VPRNPDFTAFLGAADLQGVRLGFLKQYSGVNERADRVIATRCTRFATSAREIVAVEVPAAGRIGPDEVEVLFHEFHDGIDRWLARYAPQARVRFARRLDRVQRPQRRPGDAALRPGRVPRRIRQAAAHGSQVPRRTRARATRRRARASIRRSAGIAWMRWSR
jgi:hypothetical protein